ncbi:MAG: hypothetical protein QXZ10_02600, partial [Sulfolobales archaeon]
SVVRSWSKGDVRRLYYTILLIYIAFTIWALYQTQPLILVIIAANAANFVGIFVVPAIIYLNYKLPREIRARPWENVVLVIFMALSTYFFILSLAGQLGIKI